MTSYSRGDLDGYEFKIVRANANAFRDPERLRQVCEEEARFGWRLLEKLDDRRMRFVRARGGDTAATADADPWRTHVGMSEGKVVLLVIAVVALPLIVFGIVIAMLKG